MPAPKAPSFLRIRVTLAIVLLALAALSGASPPEDGPPLVLAELVVEGGGSSFPPPPPPLEPFEIVPSPPDVVFSEQPFAAMWTIRNLLPVAVVVTVQNMATTDVCTIERSSTTQLDVLGFYLLGPAGATEDLLPDTLRMHIDGKAEAVAPGQVEWCGLKIVVGAASLGPYGIPLLEDLVYIPVFGGVAVVDVGQMHGQGGVFTTDEILTTDPPIVDVSIPTVTDTALLTAMGKVSWNDGTSWTDHGVFQILLKEAGATDARRIGRIDLADTTLAPLPVQGKAIVPLGTHEVWLKGTYWDCGVWCRNDDTDEGARVRVTVYKVEPPDTTVVMALVGQVAGKVTSFFGATAQKTGEIPSGIPDPTQTADEVVASVPGPEDVAPLVEAVRSEASRVDHPVVADGTGGDGDGNGEHGPPITVDPAPPDPDPIV